MFFTDSLQQASCPIVHDRKLPSWVETSEHGCQRIQWRHGFVAYPDRPHRLEHLEDPLYLPFCRGLLASENRKSLRYCGCVMPNKRQTFWTERFVIIRDSGLALDQRARLQESGKGVSQSL